MPHIVITSGLSIIGEKEGNTLHRVKAILLIPQPEGIVMRLTTLIGSPESIDVPDSAICYEVHDEQLSMAYFQSITGIVLARKPPISASDN